jgi:hypothetical protein
MLRIVLYCAIFFISLSNSRAEEDLNQQRQARAVIPLVKQRNDALDNLALCLADGSALKEENKKLKEQNSKLTEELEKAKAP